MRRVIIASVLILLVAAVGVWGFGQEAEVVQVDTVSVARDAVVSRLSLDGELVNDRSVEITALLDGEITTIAAREGDVVKRRQTLAEQDHVAAQAQLDRALAERDVAVAEAKDAQRKLERAQDLSRDGEMAEQAFDDARLASVRAAAAVTVAESAVTIARRTVRDAAIRAPFDGVVIHQSTETGQWVEAGTPLFTLVATAGQMVEAYVDASDIARVAIGQSATLSSDAWPAQPWQSEVDWMAPVIATSERRRSGDVPPNAVAIRLPLGDQAPSIRLGQQVDVELATDEREGVLVLPLSALRERGPGQYEVLVVAEGAVKPVAVQTGLMTRESAEITDGLEEGMAVIGSSVSGLQAGTAVQVRGDEAR